VSWSQTQQVPHHQLQSGHEFKSYSCGLIQGNRFACAALLAVPTRLLLVVLLLLLLLLLLLALTPRQSCAVAHLPDSPASG
jgi:hypothetical protein